MSRSKAMYYKKLAYFYANIAIYLFIILLLLYLQNIGFITVQTGDFYKF